MVNLDTPGTLWLGQQPWGGRALGREDGGDPAEESGWILPPSWRPGLLGQGNGGSRKPLSS